MRRTVFCSLVLGLVAPLAAAQDLYAQDLYFPPAAGNWETVEPEAFGWSSAALEQALDYAFEQSTSDLVVAIGGRIAAERYAEVEGSKERYRRMVSGATSEGRPIEDVASVQKSVVSFLVAMARSKELLELDQLVSHYLGQGWSKAEIDQEKTIAVRHLLSMTSGLSTGGDYVAPAGSQWRYNTNVYSKVVKILEKVGGQPIDQLTQEWLTVPIGMKDSRWTPRPWVRGSADANRIGFSSTARDLARFGLLILAKGEWSGRAVLGNESFLVASLESSQSLNPAYGYLWWLIGKDSLRRGAGDRRIEGTLNPAAPSDLVAALGALGRKVYVVPSLDLVVTRLGDQPGPQFDREFWTRLMKAAPVPAQSED